MFLGGYQPEGGIAAPESREYLMSEQGLRRACEEGIILEAVAVRCDLSFRLTVDLHCMNGYIEREDVQFSPTGEPVRDIAVITRVGKAVCFRVTGFFTENGKTAARLSRREAQRECAEKYLAALEPGDIIDAKVTHLENFRRVCRYRMRHRVASVDRLHFGFPHITPVRQIPRRRPDKGGREEYRPRKRQDLRDA